MTLAVEALGGARVSRKASQTSVHTSTEPILCRGIDCNVEFHPKRKDQNFCSRLCREEYFTMARTLGEMLLRRSEGSKKYKAILDGFLFQIRADERRV